MEELITLDYGSGGKKTASLIEKLILPQLDNPALRQLGDGAVVPGGEELVFSTDSFVVSPRFFPGGDIGKLAVCGTVNDICMSGGEPRWLSLALIIEEGLPAAELEQILSSVAKAAKEAGVCIVTGDTKVVEKGKGDGVYINTAALRVLVSGTVGDHGAAVMLARNQNLVQGELKSDCAPLHRLSAALRQLGSDLRVLRDPTRGGVATTLCEFVEGTALSILLEEEAIPVRPAVASACDILGLDPLYCANEGKLLAVVAPERAEEALALLRGLPEGENAAVIGTVGEQWPGRVAVRTALGGTRIAAKLAGAQLPRIC